MDEAQISTLQGLSRGQHLQDSVSVSTLDKKVSNIDDDQTNIGHQIENLARQLSRRRTTDSTDVNLDVLSPQPGTKLDSNSPTFDPRAWIRAFMKLTESEAGSAPPRSLGVAFRDLDVSGWGAGAEYQRSTLDYPVDVVKSIMGLFGAGPKKHRVNILRQFEGVVEQGELLLVLGPPGSGCSTLLKTMAGETAGLMVDPQSYMNFRGTPNT